MLTGEEEVLYDRQIRLWGRDAQQCIRQTHAILYGQFTGPSHELVKNLMLQGVARISLVPKGPPVPAKSCLFTSHCGMDVMDNTEVAEMIQREAAQLNPRVNLECVNIPVEELLSTGEMTKVLVLLEEHSLEVAFDLNAFARRNGVPSWWLLTGRTPSHTDDMGLLFCDLGDQHTYRKQPPPNPEEDQEKREEIKETVSFVSFETLWKRHLETESRLKEKTRRGMPVSFSPLLELVQNGFQDLKPSAEPAACCLGAILGAVVAQELNKAVTGRDLPIHNVLILEASSFTSQIISINS